MILLSDANVLIHMASVDGLWALARLGDVRVLDVVLRECDHPGQPGIRNAVVNAGIIVVKSEVGWLLDSERLKTAAISSLDALCVYYALHNGFALLTNDKPLRDACHSRGVPVNGTIWVVNEAMRRNVVQPATAAGWATLLSDKKYRLPADELRRILLSGNSGTLTQ